MTLFSFYYLICALISIVHSGSLNLETRQPGANDVATPESRYVYVINDVDFTQRMVSPKTGKTIFGGHTSIRVDGTSTDGPLMIEIAVHPAAIESRGFVVRVKDIGVANTGKPIGFSSAGGSQARRYVVQNGKITLTNAQIFDHQAGTGIVADAWNENPVYARNVGSAPNNCYDFVDQVLSKMEQTLDPSMMAKFTEADEYYTYKSKMAIVQKISQVMSCKTEFPDGYKPQPGEDMWIRAFDVVSNPEKSALIADTTDLAQCSKLKLAKRGCIKPSAYADDTWITDTSLTATEIDGLATTPAPDTAKIPTLAEENRGVVAPFEDTVAKLSTDASAIGTLGMGRVGGIISAVTLVAREAAQALGQVVGPVFVLLDIVEGNWVGAALAAVGMVLGLVASLAVAGPIGWIFGGAIAALFAILPGIWKSKAHMPGLADRQAILQYAFFGDATHTGNEQCQSQGNANCTAVFGPGVLSLVFNWNNFDSIAFLIQYNEGYAMTLPEIANAFYDIDDPANKNGDGTNQIATIKCNNIKDHANAWGSSGGDADQSKCNRPSFQLNRQLITLPELNTTADQIYNRIIPAPDGDCKLISDAANSLTVPEYNMTITGLPVAIACGLQASQAVDGTTLPLTPSNNPVSSGINSTDGENGHQISAPPATPFLNPLNSTNALCLSGSGGSLCVPAGGFDIQRGTQGFDSSKADTLTMPDGSSMSWNQTEPGATIHSGPTTRHVSFTTDQTSANKNFAQAMAAAPTAAGSDSGAIWTASIPANIPVPPVICLYTQSDRNGDVVCSGPGGGNVTASMSGKASSISVHGNATAKIYAQYYGDAGSATITADVVDLTQEPYGTNDNFNLKIVAMWVCDGECAVAGT